MAFKKKVEVFYSHDALLPFLLLSNARSEMLLSLGEL